MAQPLTTILSHQRELTNAARQFTGDVNEAALLVGRVVSRALGKASASGSAAEIARDMRRDLERLMTESRH